MNENTFYGLGIVPVLIETLERLKFTCPTPVQHRTLPLANEGKDILGVAQTGTGKTLAFALPMIQRLLSSPGTGLVLAPTRELALQVRETFRKVGTGAGMQSIALIGGDPMGRQINDLKKKPRIIIATPGRLNDHLERRTVHLDQTAILVLDEADRMLDMGFLPQIEKIIEHIPAQRQTMLFSATIPRDIIRLSSRYMRLPIHIEVAPSGTPSENICQELYIVDQENKILLLEKILKETNGSILIFSRTRHGAAKLTRRIFKSGINAAEIHSDRSMSQRRTAIEGFKNGRFRVLVATDIAARGIDVKGIELVINYDLPDESENYIHRAGKSGRAISFATPDQAAAVTSIEKLLKGSIPVKTHPEIAGAELFNTKRAAVNKNFFHNRKKFFRRR